MAKVIPIIALVPVARPSNPSVILAPLETEITITTIIGIKTSQEYFFKSGLIQEINQVKSSSLFFTNGIVVLRDLTLPRHSPFWDLNL